MSDPADELTPENKAALFNALGTELGIDLSEFPKIVDVRTTSDFERFKYTLKKDIRARQIEAQLYTPRLVFDDVHPEIIETRSSAEIFAEFVDENF